jgi:hypothetical protein
MITIGSAAGAVDGTAAVAVWAQSLLEFVPGLRGLEFERAAPDEHRAHVLAGMTVNTDIVVSPPWPAIVSLWTETPSAPRLPPLEAHEMTCVRVAELRAFDNHDELSRTGAVKGFKKTTFWKSAPGVARGLWMERYRAHVPTVRACHSAWAYRQNIIEEKPATCPYDAVSENWWATVTDLCERFYLSEDARRAVGEEVMTFLDRNVVATMVTRHHVLKPLVA